MKVSQAKIKQVFKQEGVQLGKGTIELVNYEMISLARKMAKKCNDGNVKSLTPELFWVAIGNPWLL